MSVINGEEDAPCQVCSSMVVEDSKALCCDLCDGWIHSACLGITASTYSMLKKLKGCWWVCDGCSEQMKCLKTEIGALASDNQALRLRLEDLQDLPNQVKCLQEQVQGLARDLDFLMDNGVIDNMTHSLPPSHSPIPVHPNPFATLGDPYSLPPSQLPTPLVQCKDSNGPSTLHYTNSEHNVQTTCCPPVESNPRPTCLPNPVPSPRRVHSHPSQNLQSPSPITSATPPQVIVYLRNVPKHLSIDQVQNRLSSEGIGLNGCSITQPLQDSTFTGSRKFLKITCSSLEKCNSLDKAIKSRSHLPWFLSLHPPYRPNKSPKVPLAQTPFLFPHPPPLIPPLPTTNNNPQIPPLMSLILPPLLAQEPQTLPPTSIKPNNPIGQTQIKPSSIPALMSLKLPPLPVLTSQAPALVDLPLLPPSSHKILHNSLRAPPLPCLKRNT